MDKPKSSENTYKAPTLIRYKHVNTCTQTRGYLLNTLNSIRTWAPVKHIKLNPDMGVAEGLECPSGHSR